MQNEDEILKDTNLGLVKQVIKKIRNEVIESLSQTNTMLEIKEIEERLKVHRHLCDAIEENQKKEALHSLKDQVMSDVQMDMSYDDEDLPTILIKLIKKGKVKARIDMKKQIVVFEDENTSIKSLVKKLEEQNTEIMEILGEVENTDKDLLMQKKAGVVEMEGPEVNEYDDMMMFDEVYQ